MSGAYQVWQSADIECAVPPVALCSLPDRAVGRIRRNKLPLAGSLKTGRCDPSHGTKTHNNQRKSFNKIVNQGFLIKSI